MHKYGKNDIENMNNQNNFTKSNDEYQQEHLQNQDDFENENQDKTGCFQLLIIKIQKKWIQFEASDTYKNFQQKFKKFKQCLGIEPEDYDFEQSDSLKQIDFKVIEMKLGGCQYSLDMNKVKNKFNDKNAVDQKLEWNERYDENEGQDENEFNSNSDDDQESENIFEYKEKIKMILNQRRQEKAGIEFTKKKIEEKNIQIEQAKQDHEYLMKKYTLLSNKLKEFEQEKQNIEQSDNYYQKFFD
ncbi:hypothetical protein PPERSA_07312 [Pseudocohnilembus persalinus]|uniref:Uncharacterized protein n=1 Tax=Pseudocohnilembus persalinus TaxID=266149 RepID=A0A0V0R6X1_PSEPJ|nr:hypothetical protein PPERSA_07312 [Pseudocohnilembus persalinus]|eukprot:KRX10227.1 hypothetical protein PPERSA_07312 [Pseudocohnilembus persalinus]